LKARIFRKKYIAVGFVEALIAIAVAGVASVVLMSIAIQTISQVLKNEVSDTMTELAIEGGSMAKKIGDNQLKSDESLFPQIDGNVGKCFAFDGEVSDPSFVKSGDIFLDACRYDSGNREDCKEYMTSDDDIFRVFCILPESVVETGLTVGKVITGLVDCDTQIAGSKCEIPDYEYFVIFKVKQVEE